MGEVAFHFLFLRAGQLSAEDKQFAQVSPEIIGGGTCGFTKFDVGQSTICSGLFRNDCWEAGIGPTGCQVPSGLTDQVATGISTGGWAANRGINGVPSTLCTDGGNIENVSISIKPYRGPATKGISLAGGHILSGGLAYCLTTYRFIGPGRNRGSTGHGISGAIPVQIGCIQPKSKVGNGVFVQRGVGRHECLHGAPGCACRSNCFGGVVVGGAGGQSSQCMGYHTHAMGTSQRVAIIPVDLTELEVINPSMMTITAIITKFKDIICTRFPGKIKPYKLFVPSTHNRGCMGENFGTTHFGYAQSPSMVCF